jgi:hypothetical protein
MVTPATEYRGHVLRAYSEKVFPTHHDPYASGRKKFSSVVLIDTIPSDGAHSRRFATPFSDNWPERSGDAIDLAIQYGKRIVDGEVQATQL